MGEQREVEATGMRTTFMVLAGVLTLAGCGYDQMGGMRERIEAAWAQVDGQLQKRDELVPSLLEITRPLTTRERPVLDGVANARARMLSAGSRDDRMGASTALTSALGKLLTLGERYPEIKANPQFGRLADELATIESRLTVERLRYNDEVRAYNAYIQGFPQMLYAAALGFAPVKYFEAPPETKVVPRMDFGGSGPEGASAAR